MLGAQAVAISLPIMKYAGTARITAMSDAVVTHEPYLRSKRKEYGPDVLYRTLGGQFVPGHHYSKAMIIQRLIQEEYARERQRVDFMLTPTSPIFAPSIDAPYVQHGGKLHRFRGPGSGLISRNTSQFNTTGRPEITVPCGFSESRLPIGVQFITRRFEEGLLFRVAAAYEDVSGIKASRPPV